MNRSDDPFLAHGAPSLVEALAAGAGAPVVTALAGLTAPATGRLHGFGPDERPLVAGLSATAGRIVAARSTVLLRGSQVGREVLVVFDGGDVTRPIIVGVLEPAPMVRDDAAPLSGQDRVVIESEPHADRDANRLIQWRVDGEGRLVIEAQRELVLRCGAASITLTRAGKVVVDGTYVLSRSSGYNKIKGAAIDIN
ncbi:DUF6484 domain-containing protein [Ideonella sp.]|uniref:DUF6484 domain-containing protein n=1 Tax=Ideonella sp. TaxID=1929293 RepID=UPI0035B2EAF8